MKTFFIVILSLLLAGSLGGNYYLYTQNQTQKTESDNQYLVLMDKSSKCIRAQRIQKNSIADLWDDQAALNDDLSDQQRKLIQTSQDYVSLIDRSIRFVQSQPQLFPGVKEKEFLDQKNGLIQSITDLTKLGNENAASKDLNAAKIKQIYLDAGEDRNNTANEREGFRENCLN